MKFTLLLFSLTFFIHSFAQLSEGDILFVGWYGDNLDGFAFVTMTTIPDGTVIYFTDNEWNGSPIGSGGAWSSTTEGFMQWTNNLGGDIPAGVVVTFEGIDVPSSQTTSCGQLTLVSTGNGTIRVNASNEVIYAYLGTSATNPTTFLSAIANDGFGNGTITNTGLTNGTNALNFGVLDADADVAVYVPGDYSQSSIMNTGNWQVEDGSFDQGQNGIYPEYPDDVPAGTEPCGIISTLPVELVAFSASPVEDFVRLNWTTMSEINNDRFEVYRSIDGETLELVGEVDGKGNSSSQEEYTLLDTAPYFGVSYYRLKQIDFDGKYAWSDFVSVEIFESEDLQLKLYPNPLSSNIFQIHCNHSCEDMKVEVLNASGQRIPATFSSNTKTIEVKAELAKGLYYVRIISNSDFKVIKLIKQ